MKKRVSHFKKYFIPHEENDHRPHLLRPRTVAFVLAVVIVLESAFILSASYVIPRSKLFGLVAVSALVDGTNAARAAANLPPLTENALLDVAARDKADDMVANGYFAHTSPAGITPWYWFQKVGYDFSSAGENLAVNFSDSADVTNAWLASPEHRANILNTGFTEVGMATAQGTYNGHSAIYVVELFANPAPTFTIGETASAATKPAPSPKNPVTKPTTVAAVSATTTAVAVATATSVAGSTAISDQANLVQTAAANPVRTVDYIYLAIAAVFALALILNVFVKIRIQHRDVILGGMIAILVIGLIIVANQHFALAGTAVL